MQVHKFFDNLTIDDLVKLGVPAIIALFLVWRLVGGFASLGTDVRVLADTIDSHHNSTTLTMQEFRATNFQTYMTGQQMLWVLRQTCVNQAVSKVERNACLSDPSWDWSNPAKPVPADPPK